MSKEKQKYILNEIRNMANILLEHVDEEEKAINNNSNGDIINFKATPNHNLSEEFERCDNRLQFIFLSYCAYMYRKYKYVPTVTRIDTTQEEQDDIYNHHPVLETRQRYMMKPWFSPHQKKLTPKCRALDFRSKDMTEEQKKDTEEYFSDKQIVYSGDLDTILHHSVRGIHFHLQVDVDDFTSIKRVY